MNTEIKKLNADHLHEFKELVQIFNAVFEAGSKKIAEDDFLYKLLNRTDFISMAAIVDNKIVGGLTAYEFPSYYGNYSEVYIYDVAIKQEYQRTGFGKLLIESLKNYCKNHQIKTMFVEAHEADTQAVNFYRNTKALAEKVVHFNYHLDLH